jgi:hypothetical protein
MRNKKVFGFFIAMLFISFFMFAQDQDVGLTKAKEQKAQIAQDVGGDEFNYSPVNQNLEIVSLEFAYETANALNLKKIFACEFDDSTKQNSDLITNNIDFYIAKNCPKEHYYNPNAKEVDKHNSLKIKLPRDSLRKSLQNNFIYNITNPQESNFAKRCPRDRLRKTQNV